MRVLPDGMREERFAITVKPGPAPISHDTEIHPLGIDAHQPAVTATKEMQLDALIHRRGRGEVRLERDVTVTPRRLANEARAPCRD